MENNKNANSKREDYISWDEYFMGVAMLSAERSKDPNTEVGACIVSDDNRILSMGYNGAPRGLHDDKMHWQRTGSFIETKYAYVCHAELNAILNYRGDLSGSKIYVKLFPCNECAKAIIQAGIKEVIYSYNYDYDDHSDEMKASIRMFEECGVTYRKFEVKDRKEIVLKLDE
jgi:dCMP deaminase